MSLLQLDALQAKVWLSVELAKCPVPDDQEVITMSATSVDQVAQTAIAVVSRLQTQLDEGIRELSETSPQSSGVRLIHPQGLDKPDHFAVFRRTGGSSMELIGTYPGKHPGEAIQAAGKQSGQGELVVVATRSLWQPQF